MRACPRCHRSLPDSLERCPDDGAALGPSEGAAGGATEPVDPLARVPYPTVPAAEAPRATNPIVLAVASLGSAALVVGALTVLGSGEPPPPPLAEAKPVAPPPGAPPAVRHRFELGAIETEGGLEPEGLRGILEGQPALHACAGPDVAGPIRLVLGVSDMGVIRSPSVDVDEQLPPSVAICLNQALIGLRVPPPASGRLMKVRVELRPSTIAD